MRKLRATEWDRKLALTNAIRRAAKRMPKLSIDTRQCVCVSGCPKGVDGILKWFNFSRIRFFALQYLHLHLWKYLRHPFAHIFTIFPSKNLIILKNQFEHANACPAASHTSSSIVELSIVHEIAMRLKSFHINNSAEWLRMNKWVCVGRELTIFGDVLFCRWASETHPSDRFINVTNIKNLYSGEKTNWFRLRFKH